MVLSLIRNRRFTWDDVKHRILPEGLLVVLVCAVAIATWMAADRTPPLYLYDGKVTPSVVRPGEEVSIVWKAEASRGRTWPSWMQSKDCPGTTQRELVERPRPGTEIGGRIWPYLARERKGRYIPNADDPHHGIVTTPPLHVPDDMKGNSVVAYRVTNYYYCNALQRLLAWPIVAVSPWITFEVKP